MLLLYAIAHVVMTHTSVGRYIYAVGQPGRSFPACR